MKRPHSYSSDPSDDDWDRPPVRRFYSSDPRPPRKRFDHDPPDDPHRRHHTSKPPSSSSSDRDRLPFSPRRDFPKGFRSERDRPRRDSPSAGGWRRSTAVRDLGDDRATRIRSRDSPARPSPESRKADRSDVEEGEFEPDPEPPIEEKPCSFVEDRKGEELVLDSDGSVEPEEKDLEEVGVVKVSVDPKETVASVTDAVEEGSGVPAVQHSGSEAAAEDKALKDGVGDDSGTSVGALPLEVETGGEAKMGEGPAGLGEAADAGEESNCMDFKAEMEVDGDDSDSGIGSDEERTREAVTLGLLTNECTKDKGKAPVISPSNEENSMEDSGMMEGPSSRGFELVFRSEVMNPEKMSVGGIVIGKSKDEGPKLEPLDLSLGLPGICSNPPFQKHHSKPNSPPRTRSFQSFASSFRTNSDDFTTSISLSGSQTFVHNPSCSLQQNSMENFEHSVHSRPIFQGIDQNSNGTVWQGQPSIELKQRGETVPLYQRILLNGKTTHHSANFDGENSYSESNGLPHQSNLSRHLHSIQSLGPQEIKPENRKESKTLTRERSSNSLIRTEQREKKHIVLNGNSFEKILAKIVSEPLQLIGSKIQEMTEHFVLYMREALREMLGKENKQSELLKLQEVLSRRSDLTLETLSKAHRVLLEILVAIKTGLPDFLVRANVASSSDLAEIFFNMKCRNLACRSNIPVDECDCKVCSQKNGFCSSCMCLICSKFDTASNTCSWVGCDVCLHWCHTDCGLCNSYIRNGRSTTGAPGTTEMQFHCIACDHTSEMFGFVKDVFDACANNWNAEILAKELEYVRRIFSASCDTRGKRLQDIAAKLLQKLENKSNLQEVHSSIMEFLAESDSKPSNNAAAHTKEFPQKSIEGNIIIPYGISGAVNGGSCIAGTPKEYIWPSSAPQEKSTEKPTWHPSLSSEKSPRIEITGASVLRLDNDHLKSPCLEITGSALPTFDSNKLGRRTMDIDFRSSLQKKPVLDELDNVKSSSAPQEKSTEKPAWHPSLSSEKSPRVEITGASVPRLDNDHLKSPCLEITGSALPTFDSNKMGRRNMDIDFRRSLQKKPVLDELDNVVKFKQEEAKMYQSRADEARREAEGLKRIAVAKSEKIDEEYSNKIAKLRLYETEERRKQKAEELQALERAQHEYFSMKIRMEADIKNLLLKMEAMKQNLNT